MKRRAFIGSSAVLVLIALAPPASAIPDPQVLADGAVCFERLEGIEGTCSVLYAHIDDLWTAFLTVQAIPPVAPDIATGTGIPSALVLGSSEFRLNPATGPMRWSEDGLDPDGIGPPVADATSLVPDVPLTGYWYMSADAREFPPADLGGGSSGSGVLPCLTVEVTLVDRGPPGQQGDATTVLAQGRTTRTIVSLEGADEQPLAVEDPCPGAVGPIVAGGVHEFRVDLERVPGAGDVMRRPIVLVHWYQARTSDGDEPEDRVVSREWNIHSGAEFRPRVVFPIETPVDVLETFIAVGNTSVHASARFMSPWGSYEFVPDAVTGAHSHHPTSNTTALRFRVLDATGTIVPTGAIPDPHLRYTLGHGNGDDLLNVTYEWIPPGDLAPGTYTLIMEADNLQGTATARAEMTYVHAPDAGRDTPAIGMGLFLGALFVGLVVAVRRSRGDSPL